jgi:VAD1 Analog of StAR-related lipid transfer domain/GRAM domain
MISHRRVRSAGTASTPSRLSFATNAPLTPTIEETKTPNGTAAPGQNSFFSSMFNAAQNAATTLQNSIANTTLAPGQKAPKIGRETIEEKDASDETSASTDADAYVEDTTETAAVNPERKPAVETLGQGELNFGHLGITMDSAPASAAPSLGRGLDASATSSMKGLNTGAASRAGSVTSNGTAQKDNMENENPTSGAQLAANGDDHTNTPVVEDGISNFSSRHDALSSEQSTPARTEDWDGETEIRRTSSIRTPLANRRRKRNSSATTATTVGANPGGDYGPVYGNGSDKGSAPRLTGFAVASKKRNRDFHQLFRSVPDNDYLLEDYGCALQREILLQGRLYVSESHICFNSNIFGWITTLVISFDEVMSIEKKNTAMVFPNAIVIQTLHARNVFASFINRDSTFDLLVGIWRVSHPSLRTSEAGVELDNGPTNVPKGVGSESGGSDADSDYDDENSDEDVYDEDEREDELGESYHDAGESNEKPTEGEKGLSRQPSASPLGGEPSGDAKGDTAGGSGGDFPGPATHAPTEYMEGNYDKVVKDEILPAPLGKIYELMFGSKSPTFMSNFFTNDLKCLDLQFEDKEGLGEKQKTRSYSYIKPLNASIGPRQTKCICTETLDLFDLEKAISVRVTTLTPDVPSGSNFSVQTRYNLMWADDSSTRLVMTCTVEWTAKSWLKGMFQAPIY